MTPTLLSHPTPLSPTAGAVPAVDSAVRISLDPVLGRRDALDGAWWPYSRDAAAELPGLIAAIDQRLGRTTLRVGLHPDAWEHIPRRIPARGRQIRVGWFRSTRPHLVTLILADAEPVTLLVIAPDTTQGPATAALALAAAGIAGLGPADVLDLSRRSTAPDAGAPDEHAPDERAPDGGDPAGWENEGGHLAGRRAP
ncbi:DUF5994 family protein [Planomonospora parontospora]|uniref:DUF5994 family protein n=1 Tax=Planomonospora parontospora TaxID=58119 RepID=UPI00166FC34B|nr:DUF5994 family protein [Planomonospora parontospora]GGL02214.1 hypothetical protein GCM10014719_00520 [Planomonospora parontospora subsp. antibiotica]GII16776.1 hypothetical protein Ppa05_35020 [Planomonospora parontospora subsp. antibiotica]